ncbi:hypothetical protein LIER_22714 [Lithospermum erythrorhizon]|uniref:Uncharacterized protein n=1 Tax=Lithospermum erythrorhizon TaxID=34254 RepID=A0AAV3QUT6_LITER
MSSLWSCICTRIEEKSLEMILKEKEGVMRTFQVLTQMGLGGFPNLHDKLQGFFQKVREIDTALTAASQDSTSVASHKLIFLMASRKIIFLEKLDLKAADTSQQVHDLDEEIRAERAKHLGH